MVIRFGLELDDQVYPLEGDGSQPVQRYCGVAGLIQLLEKIAGLSYPGVDEYIRIEQYRQLLAAYIHRTKNTAFYKASFEADALATATALLARRDELYLAGWDFQVREGMPSRLRAFAELETLMLSGSVQRLSVGRAERWRAVVDWVQQQGQTPLQRVYLNEPLALLPPYLRSFFNLLQQQNVSVVDYVDEVRGGTSALGAWQRALLKRERIDSDIPDDHSIIILRAKRETQLAAYLAKWVAANPHHRPLCLIPHQNRALDNALIQEGVPSLGILSASLARPTLQILKLLSTFLCEPVNPYKILEFLSLPNRPLHDDLARKIAETIAEKPGLFSSALIARVREFFEDMEQRIQREKRKNRRKELQRQLKETEDTYRFLFDRRRYDSQQPIPKTEVASAFRFLHIWALKRVEELHKRINELNEAILKAGERSKDVSKQKGLKQEREELQNILKPLLALLEQSNRVWKIIEALPEQESFLSFLQLERLVRTVSEATPVRFRQPETHHLPYVYSATAIAEPTDELLWWNFIQTDSSLLFARWYSFEMNYLQSVHIPLDNPESENRRRLWQAMQPALRTGKRLVIAIPQQVDGKEAHPHLLWSDLEAFFGEKRLHRWTIDVDQCADFPDWWKRLYQHPEPVLLQPQPTAPAHWELEVPQLPDLINRPNESFSSLEMLLYSPHQWVFRYIMDLRPSSILSVISMDTLKGNLAHNAFQTLFEKMKAEGHAHWSRQEVEQLMERQAQELLQKEGVVLLMYGKEPERIHFINRLKTAAWALVENIRSNGWSVFATEHEVDGKLGRIGLHGIADLVLENDKGRKVILDLKWSGLTRRKEDLKNNTDLQLVIYSNLLNKGEGWSDTAFFIIENAKILARNHAAFRQAHVEQPIENTARLYQDIWEKIYQTYEWRMEQLRSGKIEIRTEENFEKVEEMTQFELEGRLLQMLEMRKDKLNRDRYKTLIT